MENQFSLNIKTPCSEKFEHFAPTPNGGFCNSCTKEVVDFSNMNAQAIGDYFKNKATSNTCGRFNATQLTTYSPQSKRVSFLRGIGLACLSLFSMVSAQAQDTKTLEALPQNNPSDVKASQFQNNIVVKGSVSDGITSLPGVNIILEGTTTGVQSDFDGNFVFPTKLKKGDVLVFSYVGMTSQKVVIVDENSTANIELNIDMKMDSCIIMGKVAVKQIYKSKRD